MERNSVELESEMDMRPTAAWLCFAWIYLLPALASAAESGNVTKKTIQHEAAVLRSCARDSCPVFYVSALGRAFPIPTRYWLTQSYKSTPGFTRFVSPIPEFASSEEVIAGEALIGSIVIGPLDKLRKSEKEGAVILRRLGSMEGVEMFALSLAERRDSEVAQVLTAGNEYVQIGDQNPQLAELLLNLSSRVKKPSNK